MRQKVGKLLLRQLCAVFLAASLLAAFPSPASAYSILAHEAIIDAAWDVGLRALLVQRFPDATKEQLKEAHAYAYGGAIIQDLGYYPHGSHFFSDLTHYCRSGDFILALLHDSKDLNGYAFALGALSHYAADNDGHAIGTNPSVPILYPKLEKKYGPVVTYEQNPLAHVKTEFGFDVLEVAKQRYAPDSYHDFIGFEVDAPLLEQAFRETYGLDLKVALPDEDKALGSYRRSVSKLIPKATRIAWTLKKNDIQKDQPSITKRKFLYNVSRSSYEKNWGKDYQKPTLFERFIALLYRILPKFGPLRVLQLRTPTPETEHKFEESFNDALDRYKLALRAARDGQTPDVPNDNFDTGKSDPPGVYFMNDDVHAQLVEELAKTNFKEMSPALRAELTQFYSDPNAPYATKRKPKEWAKLQAALHMLKAAPAAPAEAQTLPAYGGMPSAPAE
ncbi:MAG TPA: zinc dependent phospholipase C family protein [Candidatus Sulfotelmatobacter sp.]|nr:zinc dependent phospholipase C family protein [Candidatus Sulfotelmatobacter sp.]